MKYLKHLLVLVSLAIFFIIVLGFLFGVFTGILNSAQTKSTDTAIKAGLLEIVIEIEKVYSPDNGFEDFMKEENFNKANYIHEKLEKQTGKKVDSIIAIKGNDYIVKLRDMDAKYYFCLDTVEATTTKISFTNQEEFDQKKTCK